MSALHRAVLRTAREIFHGQEILERLSFSVVYEDMKDDVQEFWLKTRPRAVEELLMPVGDGMAAAVAAVLFIVFLHALLG